LPRSLAAPVKRSDDRGVQVTFAIAGAGLNRIGDLALMLRRPTVVNTSTGTVARIAKPDTAATAHR